MRLPSLVLYSVLIASVCVCGVGCNSNNKGKIEGTAWASQAMTVKGQLVPAKSVRFEFTADGKLTYWVMQVAYTGRYTLGFGDYVTLHLDKELAGSKTHRQQIIIRGDTLQLIDTDGTKIVFDRVK